jgi:preprotein translocase subunit YajC
MDMYFFLQDPASGAAPGTPPQAPAAPPAPTTGTQPAPGSDPAAAAPGGGIVQMLPMFVMIFVVMYFMLLRPQRKQQKEREMLISNLKKNDKVWTNTGLYGIVKQANPADPHLILCIDESKDVRVKVLKSAISGLDRAASAEGETKADAPKTEKAKS